MTGLPQSPRVLLAITAASFALALLLNFAYTTWALNSEFRKSCSLLSAQSSSPAYPAAIRREFAVLAQQRGC